jgi:hypothetical protein
MVYKYIHIVGTSPDSIAKAMEDAVDEAAKTVKSIRWAELGRVTLRIENQKIGVSGGSKNWFRSRTRSKIVPYFIAKLHPKD